MRKWRIATEDEILQGKTTDAYFERTLDILRKEDENPTVHAEVTVSSLPSGLEWGVMAGVDDALMLFEGKNLDIYGLEEGTAFYPWSQHGIRTPVLAIEGSYQEFVLQETPMLGFLCHTSGMVSKTAHLRIAAGEKSLLSFGARRTHPAITPQVEYAAYIGGCDGVSCVLGAELIDLQPTGTMPHSLIIAFQDHIRAWQAYDRHEPKDIPRIALTDTYLDEVTESIMAAENMDSLMGVRLDTTGSRRGNFKQIIQEVRWELDVRGYKDLKIFISGGLDVQSVTQLSIPAVDGFGVGGAISNSPAIDFAMDIVAIQKDGHWKPAAKRGKFSGKKMVWRCEQCLRMETTLMEAHPPRCGHCGIKMTPITTKLMEKGRILQVPKHPKELRRIVLDQLDILKEQNEGM